MNRVFSFFGSLAGDFSPRIPGQCFGETCSIFGGNPCLNLDGSEQPFTSERRKSMKSCDLAGFLLFFHL